MLLTVLEFQVILSLCSILKCSKPCIGGLTMVNKIKRIINEKYTLRDTCAKSDKKRT